MTLARGRAHPDRLFALLDRGEQISTWRAALEELVGSGRRLAVAHSSDRREHAHRLAVAHGAIRTPLRDLPDVETIARRGDLLIVISSAGASGRRLQEASEPQGLRRLLRRGVVVWTITGPRPNPLTPYSHDSLAVPEREPTLLIRSHYLVIRRLTDRTATDRFDHRPDERSSP